MKSLLAKQLSLRRSSKLSFSSHSFTRATVLQAVHSVSLDSRILRCDPTLNVSEQFQGDDIMILEYAYDLPGTGCRVWVKIYYWITADLSDPIRAKLSDGGVDILPPG